MCDGLFAAWTFEVEETSLGVVSKAMSILSSPTIQLANHSWEAMLCADEDEFARESSPVLALRF